MKAVQAVALMVLLVAPTGCDEVDRVVRGEPEGQEWSWSYAGYDSAGWLRVTGRMSVRVVEDGRIKGEWRLQAAETGIVPLHPVGRGRLAGAIGAGGIWVDLHPGYMDNNIVLSGGLSGAVWSGRWTYSTIVGIRARGTFLAHDVEAGGPSWPPVRRSPPAAPAGPGPGSDS